MVSQSSRQLRTWLGGTCALVVALALSACTTVKPPEPTPSPGLKQARVPEHAANPAQPSKPAESSLSAKQILDRIGEKWKYADPPVVVFHSPG